MTKGLIEPDTPCGSLTTPIDQTFKLKRLLEKLILKILDFYNKDLPISYTILKEDLLARV